MLRANFPLIFAVSFGAALSGCTKFSFNNDAELSRSALSNPDVTIDTPEHMEYAQTSELSRLMIRGKCNEDGRTVALTGDVETQVTCQDGEWSTQVDVSGLSDEEVVLHADFENRAGLQATQVTRIFIKDTLAPTLGAQVKDPITSSVISTSASTSTLAITAPDEDIVAYCLIEQDAGAAAPAAPTVSSDCWHPSKPNSVTFAAQGWRKVFVYAKDHSGNISIDATSTIFYASGPPANPGFALTDVGTASTSHSGATTVNAAITGDWSAEKWCLSETQNTAPAAGNPCWVSTRPTTFALSGGDAAKTVYLWVMDPASAVNGGVVSDAITLDTLAPARTYNALAPASPTNAATQTVSGTCSDASSGIPAGEIRICLKSSGTCSYPADYTASTNCVAGNYTYSASMTEGLWDVEVVAVDAVGNASAPVGQGAQNYRVDTTIPVLGAITAPASAIPVSDTHYVFAWNAASDAGGSALRAANTYQVEAFANGTCSGAAAATTTQAGTSYDYTGLVNGTSYSIRLTAYDNAGNASTTACSPAVGIDTAGPALSYNLTPSSPTKDVAQTISGSCADPNGVAASGIKICLKSSGTCAYPADYGVSVNCVAGNYSYNAGMTQNLWDVEVVGVDTLGNASSPSGQAAQNYRVDTTAPTLGGFTFPASNLWTKLTSYTFSWNAASDTGGSNFNNYKVERFDNGTCTDPPVGSVDQTATSYAYSSLVDGGIYSVRLSARDNAGNISSTACTNSVSVDTTVPTLGAFTAPASNVSIGVLSYDFIWNAASDNVGGSGLAAANRYKLEKFNNGTCTDPPVDTVNQNALNYNWTSLAYSNTYSVRLTAYDVATNASTTACSFAVTTPDDPTPDAFSFTDNASVLRSAVTDSNILQITGITGSQSISIAGGSGQYRICNDATCSAAPAFGSGATTITNGKYVQLRLTSSASWATPISTTLTVGTGSDTWTVTTYSCSGGSQSFTSSGTWTRPSGAITSVTVTMVGGGGGGGSAYGGGGGGGGSGQSYVNYSVAVSGNVSVTVGAGGGTQAPGNASYFGALMAAGGAAGGGGCANDGVSPACTPYHRGGAGGNGGGGAVGPAQASNGNGTTSNNPGCNASGGAGGNQDAWNGNGGSGGNCGAGGGTAGANHTNSSTGAGGGGGGSIFGTGGAGANESAVPSGSAFGGNAGANTGAGGGGGGGGTDSVARQQGGSGGSGRVDVTWSCP